MLLRSFWSRYFVFSLDCACCAPSFTSSAQQHSSSTLGIQTRRSGEVAAAQLNTCQIISQCLIPFSILNILQTNAFARDLVFCWTWLSQLSSQAGAKDTARQIIKMSVKQRVIFTDRREEIGRSVAGGHNHEHQILDPDSEVRSTIYYLTHPGPRENWGRMREVGCVAVTCYIFTLKLTESLKIHSG